MKLAPRRRRFTRADWIGYSVLILAGGACGLVALFLPWANEYTDQSVNFSLSKPPAVAGVLATQWGPPVLVAALAAVAAAVLLLALGPRRLTVALSLMVVAAGAVFAVESVAAADSMAGLYRPGLGLYLTLLTGVLLVPVGLASIAVGEAMRRHTAGSGAATPGPPAPGTAPPS